ncbi:MAG: metallophosphoesterase, partial [Flavobacteriales bacterium]|nr:metallophosphoesterase [Flavobacteriales bacterium]
MKLTLILFSFLFSVTSIYANTEKYRLCINDDPATTMTVAWGQNGGTGTMVHYGPVDFGMAFASYPMSQGIDRQTSAKGMTNCFSRLTGLLPDTEYYFVINDSDGTSQRMWFKTLTQFSNEPISLLAGGDSRIYLDNSARVNANSLVAKLKPDAIMFAGDFTWLDLDIEWESWFDDWQLTIASDGRMSPIIVARGNHEFGSADLYDMFDTPTADQYYGITLGGDLLRLYTLNTEISIGGTQKTWLENDLIATGDNVDWKFAQYHKPMRPHVSSEPEGNDQYNNWAKLFYDYGVRVVLDCDSHDTKVTWPVAPSTSATSEGGFEREDMNGTVYIGEGGWGVPLRTNNDNKSWTRDAGEYNSFHWIIVKRDTVEIRTIITDNASSVGEVLNSDRFTPPANLDVWNPSNGDVVYLVNNKYLGRPFVDVTYPFQHQYFSTPQLATIAVTATDTNGTIDYVEFLVNDTPIGTDSTFPYTMDWTMPTDGSYYITAWAYDNDGVHNISDDIQIFVGDINVTMQIQASDDDAEEYKDDGSVDLTSTDIELCVEEWPWPISDEDQWVGLRFQGVDIPAGAIVNSAYIEFTSDEGQSGGVTIIINGEAEDSPEVF